MPIILDLEKSKQKNISSLSNCSNHSTKTIHSYHFSFAYTTNVLTRYQWEKSRIDKIPTEDQITDKIHNRQK